MIALFKIGVAVGILTSARGNLPKSHQTITDTHLLVEITDCAIRYDTLHRTGMEHRIGDVNPIDSLQEINS
jgi:hypothetical protein